MEQRISGNTTQYIWGRAYFKPQYNFKRILYDKLDIFKTVYQRDLLAHYGCVNAIEFSKDGSFLVSGGDDRRVLMWDVQSALQGVNNPVVMTGCHVSNIFCLCIDSNNEKVYSAGNDDQIIIHDLKTGVSKQHYFQHQPIYCLSLDPLNNHVFASACDGGKLMIHDIRDNSAAEGFILADSSSAFHSVAFNPTEPRLIASANAKEGTCLWDVRKPKQLLLRYGGRENVQSCMSVRWDQAGKRLLGLRRRLPPVLYYFSSSKPVAQFDHAGYYNSCTMKSCSFAGDRDQYILSGSDDFNLYVWKTPKSDAEDNWVYSAHKVLRGHRSIVNQVRYDPNFNIIASSGVEKLIKFWSSTPFPPGEFTDKKESKDVQPNFRKVFTHEEYLSYVLTSGEFITHDYSNKSTNEDPRMMAFFDSLVQREIEGWSSDTSDSSKSDEEGEYLSNSAESKNMTGNSSHQEENRTAVDVEQNPIVDLIAKKRTQLVKMAKSGQNEFHRVRKRLRLDSDNDSLYDDDSAISDFKIMFGETYGPSTSKNNNCSEGNSHYANGAKRRKTRFRSTNSQYLMQYKSCVQYDSDSSSDSFLL